MKNTQYVIVIGILVVWVIQSALNEYGSGSLPSQKQSNSQIIASIKSESTSFTNNSEIWKLFQQQQSNVWVIGEGQIVKLLSDDNQGSRHQRFIVKVNLTQTILIAHNIDLAERLADIQLGDMIRFRGEYIWNNKGGVVHWTHHDPSGKTSGGWIKHKNVIYQ